MSKPISNERVEWMRQRVQVLDECIRISQVEAYALQGGKAQREDLTGALRGFQTERMSLMVELKALEKFGVTP